MSVKHRHEDMSGSADFFWLGETLFEWEEPFSVRFLETRLSELVSCL